MNEFTFGKWVVINLELCNMLVLVRGDGNELHFREDNCLYWSKIDLANVVGLDKVKTWLILVHRVQYRLNLVCEEKTTITDELTLL